MFTSNDNQKSYYKEIHLTLNIKFNFLVFIDLVIILSDCKKEKMTKSYDCYKSKRYLTKRTIDVGV